MSSSYRMELDKWLGQLDVKADRVLDIGGSQLPVKGRTKSWDVKEYLIADLPEPHVGSPRPQIELDMNYLYATKRTTDNIDLSFTLDLIFCLEVFDYVYDPAQAFQNLWALLKMGGTAWVTFPSFYPLHQPIEDDALRYMPGGVEKLAKAAGLEIKQIIFRRPVTNGLERFYADERMRAAKHQDHHFTGMIVEFTK